MTLDTVFSKSFIDYKKNFKITALAALLFRILPILIITPILFLLVTVPYPLNHPQEQTQGAAGSCFVNHRPQQGQCLVHAFRCPRPEGLPPGRLTRSFR